MACSFLVLVMFLHVNKYVTIFFYFKTLLHEGKKRANMTVTGWPSSKYHVLFIILFSYFL